MSAALSPGWEGSDVRAFGEVEVGTVVRWEPLSAGMCDALVRFPSRECWYSTSSLRPLDGQPRQSREEARRAADAASLMALQAIRDRHTEEFRSPWPGCEHGKAIVGAAIDAAIIDVRGRLP